MWSLQVPKAQTISWDYHLQMQTLRNSLMGLFQEEHQFPLLGLDS